MGRGVRTVICIFLLLLSLISVFATTGLESVGDISRIADFDNDGYLEALGFSDRISNNDETIRYYEQDGTIFSGTAAQTLTTKDYHFCSMSYQDSDLDGFTELFFSCQNSSNGVEGLYYEFNGTQFVNQLNFSSNISTIPGTSLSDTLFLDFTGDNRADILSCFHVDESNNTLLYVANNTGFSQHTTTINISQFETDDNYACAYTALDFDGDGDFDLLTYVYDGSDITLYENTQDMANLFVDVTNTSWYNVSFFADKRIKTISAFDSNQDGFSDLVYVIDTGETNGQRDIEFGQLLNQHRQNTSVRTLTDTTLLNITTHFENDTLFNMSWETQTGAKDYVEFSIAHAKLQIDGVNTTTLPFTQLIFNSTNFEFGTIFESSYDENAHFGNIRYHDTSLNYTLPLVQYNISLESIAPSKQRYLNTSIYNYTPTYVYTSGAANGSSFTVELCDGLDNDGDGVVDNDFVIVWPDNVSSNFTIDADNDGYVEPTYSQTRGGYTVTVDCSAQNQTLDKCYDYNDANSGVGCSAPVVGTPTDTTTSGTTGGASGGVAPAPSTTTDVDDTTVVVPDETTPEPKPDQPSPQSTKAKSKEFEIFTEITYNDDRTIITESIKNIERTQKENIQVRKIIPKEVLEKASLIKHTNEMVIIKEDPIVEFAITELGYLEQHSISYSLPGYVSKKDVKSIETVFTSTNSLTVEEIEEVEEIQTQIANETLIVNTTETVVGNQTILTIELDLQSEIDTVGFVEIEQEIPKCLIAEITESILEAAIDPALLDSVEIKEADPIIVWNLKNVDRAQQLQLKLDTFREEDCEDETKLKVLAQSYIRENQEINGGDLFRGLRLTILVLFVYISLFILATKDYKKHASAHIHRLVKIITHRMHRGEKSEHILADLEKHDENKSDLTEALAHIHKKKLHTGWAHFTSHLFEILIFLTLFILNLIDFIGFDNLGIASYYDWIKKLISFVLILFILYKVNLTKLLFNNTKPILNFALIGSMFLMHLKNLIQFAKSGLLEERIGPDIGAVYTWIWQNQIVFTQYLFLTGAVLLLVLSIWIAKTVRVREGSLYFLFTKYEVPKNFGHLIVRSIKIWLLSLLFFFLIFNRLVEWLAISIDATVFVVATILLLLLLLSSATHGKDKKHGLFHSFMKALTQSSTVWVFVAFIALAFVKPFISQVIFISILYGLAVVFISLVTYLFVSEIKTKYEGLEHVTTAVDSLYEKFLKLFSYPQTLLLGIAGLFVLQNVVEIALYLISNITGHVSHLYIGEVGETLLSLFTNESVIATHLFTLSLFDRIFAGILYAVSLQGYFFLFFMPVLLWLFYFTHRKYHPTRLCLSKVVYSEHKWLSRFATYALTSGFVSIFIGLYTQILRISPISITSLFSEQETAGIFVTAHAIELTIAQVLSILGLFFIGVVVAGLFIHFRKTRALFLRAAMVVSLGLLTYFYVVPNFISLYSYGLILIESLYAGLLFQKVVTIFVLVFFILEIILLYGVGLLYLLFLTLSPKHKQAIVHWMTHLPFLSRTFFIASDMMFLHYYSDAKQYVAGNLIHHLKKFIIHELQEGHHLETIVLQLKLHNYPHDVIEEAVREVSDDDAVDIEIIAPQHVNARHVQKLIRKIRRQKQKTFLEMYELYEGAYSEAEIKLAYRYAHNKLKEHLTSANIESDVLSRVHELHEKVTSMQKQKKSRKYILAHLEDAGYDPELILRILDVKKQKTYRLEHIVDLISKIEHKHSKKERESAYITLFDGSYSQQEILYGLTYVVKHKKERRFHALHHTEISQVKDLIQWIKTAKEKKYTVAKIKTALKKEGWDLTIITAILDTDILTKTQSDVDQYLEHQFYLIEK